MESGLALVLGSGLGLGLRLVLDDRGVSGSGSGSRSSSGCGDTAVPPRRLCGRAGVWRQRARLRRLQRQLAVRLLLLLVKGEW